MIRTPSPLALFLSSRLRDEGVIVSEHAPRPPSLPPLPTRLLTTPQAVLAYLRENPEEHQLSAFESWDSFCVEEGWFASARVDDGEVWLVVPMESEAHHWLESLRHPPEDGIDSPLAWAPWCDVWSLPEAAMATPSPGDEVPETGV
jgi:hypothetical protein